MRQQLTQQRLHEPAALGERQLAQIEFRVPLEAFAGGDRAQMPALVFPFGAIDAEEEEGSERQRLHEYGEQVEREAVGPVEVLTHQDQRLALTGASK